MFESSFSALIASRISSSVGRRYSFPCLPSTTTDVMVVPRCPFKPSCCKSSLDMIVPQQGQVTPEPDIVPPPTRLSNSLRCAIVPLESGTSFCTPKTTPVLSGFGSIVSATRLLSFLHSQRVLINGTVARQFLQMTVRAQR